MIATRSDFGKLLHEKGLDAYPAAEIGVAEGHYSLEILQWGVPRLYMVDLWEHVPGIRGDLGETNEVHQSRYEEAMERVSEFGDKAVILRGLSVDMANAVVNGLLGFVHIDSTHEYKDVLEDLEAWYPKLVSGGIMSGHDYLNMDWGVNQAVTEFARDMGVHVHTVDENRVNDACFWFEKG
ncbi:MAG: class I SAM-dependent methyltransferase [Planctomycetota bacterium]|jgi:hypothetical protein